MRLKKKPHIFTSKFVIRVFLVDENLLNNTSVEKMMGYAIPLVPLFLPKPISHISYSVPIAAAKRWGKQVQAQRNQVAPSAVSTPPHPCAGAELCCLKPSLWFMLWWKAGSFARTIAFRRTIVFLQIQQLLLQWEERKCAQAALLPARLSCMEQSPSCSHNPACSWHPADTEISAEVKAHILIFFPNILLHKGLFTTLQSFCSLKQAFNLNPFFLPSSAFDILTTFLFMDTPLCLCFVSDKKPTGLSQLLTTKEKKRDQLFYHLICFIQSIH